MAGAFDSLEDREVSRRDLDRLEDEAAANCVKFMKNLLVSAPGMRQPWTYTYRLGKEAGEQLHINGSG